MDDNCKLIYPIGLSNKAKLDFFKKVDKLPVRHESDIPEGISYSFRNKKRLVILGDDDSLLRIFLNIFPFGFYSVIGQIETTDELLANEQKVSNAEYVLPLCPITETWESVIGRVCPRSYIIRYKKVYKHKFGDCYQFNFGKNDPDKQYFVMIPTIHTGLLWNARAFLYSKSILHEEIPFVDMQNYFNQHVSPIDLGRYNAWEYFFKQLCEKSCDFIYTCANVIVCNKIQPLTFDLNREQLSVYFKKMEEDYFKKLSYNPSDTLGVFLRGTDYAAAKWHPSPLDPYETIVLAEQYMSHYKLKNIFLDTEDIDNYLIMKEYFGERLFAIDRQRYRAGDRNEQIQGNMSGFEGIEVGKEYLLETLLVSRTYGVLSSNGTSANVIRAYGKDFNHFFEINLQKNKNGSYGPDYLEIQSHNKNHLFLESIDTFLPNIDVSIEGQIVNVKGKLNPKEKFQITKSVSIFLKPYQEYQVSSNLSRENLSLFSIKFIDSSGKELIHPLTEQLLVPQSKYVAASLVVQSESETTIDVNIKLQIEEGHFVTEYEPHLFSITKIGLLTENNLFYKSKYIKSINLDDGTFQISSSTFSLNKSELQLIRSLIRYPNGYCLYRLNGQLLDQLHDIPTHESCVDDYERLNNWFLDEKFTPMAQQSLLDYMFALIKTGDSNLVNMVYKRYERGDIVPEYSLLLARINYKGEYVDKNIELSIKYYQDAIRLGSVYAREELSDNLFKIDDPKYYPLIVSLLEEQSRSGVVPATYNLARLYRDGKGVEKDKTKAIELLRSIEKQSDMAKIALYDILKGDNPEDYGPLIDILRTCRDDNVEAKLRLARLYRDGKGVEKDNIKAINLYKDAYYSGLKWISIELCDYMWKQNNDDFDREVVSILNGLSTANAYARLSNAYRLGRGVQKNIQIAIDYMERAYKCDPAYGPKLIELKNTIKNSTE